MTTINSIDTPDYKFTYVDIAYDNSDVSPYLELCRHREAVKIKSTMVAIFSKYNLSPSNKRSLRENINHMFARVLFHTFSHKKQAEYDDPMFHGCVTQNDVIVEDIKALFTHIDGLNINSVINDLNIPGLFRSAALAIKNATDNDTEDASNIYTVTNARNKVLYTIKSFDDLYRFYIPTMVYNKLKRRYDEYAQQRHKYDFTYLMCCLLLRYNTMSSIGNQFGIPIDVKEQFKKIGFNFECFASSLNHHYKYYCSIFYDIEKYFMSLGHFQNITYYRGLYMANPPYELSLLNSMVQVITQAIDQACENVLFCYGTPTWATYGEFEFHKNSRTSKFYKWHHTFDNYQIPWFDFMNNKYLKITSSTRYVLSNYDTPITEYKKIIKYWIQYKPS